MLNKDIIIELLNKAEELNEIDNKHLDALNKYFDIVYPSSYSPIDGPSQLSAFLEAIKIADKEIYEVFSYFFYECSMMDSGGAYEENGIRYNIQNKEDVLKYLFRK